MRPAPTQPTSKLTVALTAMLAVSLAINAGLALRRAPAADDPTPASSAGSDTAPAPASASDSASGSRPKPLDPDLTPYAALGSYVAATNRIPDLAWNEDQFAAFAEGLRAAYTGRPYPFDDAANALRDDINQKVRAMLAARQPDPVEEYFAKLRANEGVQKTASNLHYRISEPGAGEPPADTDTVVLSYAARLPDGRNLPELTRARVRVKPADLLPGLREGLQLLRPAGKGLLYLPPELSFGDGTWPDHVPRGTPVAFFVELHEVVRDDW